MFYLYFDAWSLSAQWIYIGNYINTAIFSFRSH